MMAYRMSWASNSIFVNCGIYIYMYMYMLRSYVYAVHYMKKYRYIMLYYFCFVLEAILGNETALGKKNSGF